MPAAMPKRALVGPYTYSITCDARSWPETIERYGQDHNMYGITDPRLLEIHVNPHVAADQQRETLLHELLHACHFATGLGAEQKVRGETFVTRTSPVLASLLMRNPAVVAYLTGA